MYLHAYKEGERNIYIEREILIRYYEIINVTNIYTVLIIYKRRCIKKRVVGSRCASHINIILDHTCVWCIQYNSYSTVPYCTWPYRAGIILILKRHMT